jgi:hypothetical protein
MSFRPVVITVTDGASPAGFERHGEPVTLGVLCPQGAVHRSTCWGLTDQWGSAVPLQTTALDRWRDGSVRWLLVDFRARSASGKPRYYALAPDAAPSVDEHAIGIEHAGDVIRVTTGVATFELPRSGSRFLSRADVAGENIVAASAVTAEDHAGNTYQLSIRRTVVELSGALRATIRLDGHLVGRSGSPWLDVTMRLNLFAGLGTIKAEFGVTNPRAAHHPGGVWDLGDPGSVLIRDLSIAIEPATTGHADVWGSLDQADQMTPAGERFAVHQESSGGSNWQHDNHVNRDGRVPARFRGFRAVRAGRDVEGLRATPIASIGGGDRRITVALPRFWEVFPKAIEADAHRCTLAMFPRAFGDAHELQGGERSTLSFAMCFGRDTVSAEPLAWIRSPLQISADPIVYRQSGGWAPLGAGSAAAADGYETLVTSIIQGPETFVARREVIDEYGWRNFGDLYADHEGPLVSHYNNQYDALAGFITRFLQTADHRWWTLADDLAAHILDIDLYHSRGDRSVYSGGYFWHTQHYQPAATATHRAYSKRTGSAGGGPSSEHNYTTGLMLHHFLTGSERSRAAVIQLANWVIDMDDGRKSRFRWIDGGETGYASVTRSPDFHGPGRGAANSINALLDAHRLTNEPRYLSKAESLVQRCVHPDDDPAAINPLDVENRWSYTIFLQAIGKYLEYRAERGLIDAKYQYARGVLLKWAAWMHANERPYLETPEQLEFPNETWAAQDIRKAAVFEFAARHTNDDEVRASLMTRADAFVDYAIAYLLQSPRGCLTRPLVLLLAYGFQRPMATPPPVIDVASARPFPRQKFTPFRQRLKTRLALAGAGLSAVAFVLVVLLAS